MQLQDRDKINRDKADTENIVVARSEAHGVYVRGALCKEVQGGSR